MICFLLIKGLIVWYKSWWVGIHVGETSWGQIVMPTMHSSNLCKWSGSYYCCWTSSSWLISGWYTWCGSLCCASPCVGFAEILLMVLLCIGIIGLTITLSDWTPTPTNLHNSLMTHKCQQVLCGASTMYFMLSIISNPTSICSWFNISMRAWHLFTMNSVWLEATSKVWPIKDA